MGGINRFSGEECCTRFRLGIADYEMVIEKVAAVIENDLADITAAVFLYGSTSIDELVPGLSDLDFAIVSRGDEVETDAFNRHAQGFLPILSDPMTRVIWHRPFVLYNSKGFQGNLDNKGSYLYFLQKTGKQIFGPPWELPDPDMDKVREELVRGVTSYEKYGYLLNEFFRCWESPFPKKRLFSTLEHSLITDGQSLAADGNGQIPVLRDRVHEVLDQYAPKLGDPELPSKVRNIRQSWNDEEQRVEDLQQLYLRVMMFYHSVYRLLRSKGS